MPEKFYNATKKYPCKICGMKVSSFKLLDLGIGKPVRYFQHRNQADCRHAVYRDKRHHKNGGVYKGKINAF